MDSLGTYAFWLTVATATAGAFALPPGSVRWVCIGIVALAGALFAAANAAIVIRRKRASLIPIFGGLLLALSVAAIPIASVRWWALTAVLLDPWLALTLYVLVAERDGTTPEALLVEIGAPPRLLRHVEPAGRRPLDVSLEELVVALADKLWKGVRRRQLEERVIDTVAEALGKVRWDVFVELDTVFESIAADGARRLARSVP